MSAAVATRRRHRSGGSVLRAPVDETWRRCGSSLVRGRSSTLRYYHEMLVANHRLHHRLVGQNQRRPEAVDRLSAGGLARVDERMGLARRALRVTSPRAYAAVDGWIAHGAAAPAAEKTTFIAVAGGLPRAVVKVGNRRPDSPLARELRALETLRDALPDELPASIPSIRGRLREGSLEALVLSVCPGRSMYVELFRGLRPGARLQDDLAAVGTWLGRVHAATTTSSQDSAHATSPAMAVSHGDYWVRNVLVERHVSVVDWERFRERAPIVDDLFHFPLTLAFVYPGSVRYRRWLPDRAFDEAFLRRTRLARAVHAYFRSYCSASGQRLHALRPLLARFLETTGPSALDSTRPPARSPAVNRQAAATLEASEACSRMARRLTASASSVFST